MVYKNKYPPEPPPKDAPDSGMETYKQAGKRKEEPKKPPRDGKMGQGTFKSLRHTDNGERPSPR